MSRLWYRKPAAIWEEALPVGNGRLGGMIFGDPSNEHIQTNEESIFYGTTANRINPNARENLPKIRELIFEGKIKEAEELMVYAFTGCPNGMHQYQPLGDITIDFKGMEGYTDYVRELDLDTAVYKQTHKVGDTSFTRELVVSKPDDVMVLHVKAEGSKKLNFNVMQHRERYFDGEKQIGDKGICLYGNLGKGGFDFATVIIAEAKDGSVRNIGDRILVEDATDVEIYICGDSSYHVAEDKLVDSLVERINAAMKKGIEKIKEDHIKDYKEFYDRVEFSLGDVSEYDEIPTDERILAAAEKPADKGLSKLYFDFGRYLTIACSREGGLPSTLQGLWNYQMTPPWECKYTININTEMNYWPVEMCDLGECHMPLFELLKKMVPNGEKVAREMYGCGGWVCHHNTDIHGDCAPQDIWVPGTYWVMGGAWLCTHIWNHYEYSLDKEFLKEYFPIERGAAEFFLDFLVEKDGHLVTCPSVSPENSFTLPSGETGANTYGVTMDNQILRDLFTQCIKSAEVLGVDDELNSRIKDALSKLIPTQIGPRGNILEWPLDYEEPEPGHRHISHLYGLFPSNQINVDETPELAKAARVTLERRLSFGGGHTGWSRAWITNHYAKLRDGEEAYNNILKLFSNSTYLNLFDKHPPFQIDGNFGVTAAIAQMVVQSTEDRIIIFPAMPEVWKKDGCLKGVRVRGLGRVDLAWAEGKLTACDITFEKEHKATVVFGEKTYSAEWAAGEKKSFVDKF